MSAATDQTDTGLIAEEAKLFKRYEHWLKKDGVRLVTLRVKNFGHCDGELVYDKHLAAYADCYEYYKTEYYGRLITKGHWKARYSVATHAYAVRICEVLNDACVWMNQKPFWFCQYQNTSGQMIIYYGDDMPRTDREYEKELSRWRLQGGLLAPRPRRGENADGGEPYALFYPDERTTTARIVRLLIWMSEIKGLAVGMGDDERNIKLYYTADRAHAVYHCDYLYMHQQRKTHPRLYQSLPNTPPVLLPKKAPCHTNSKDYKALSSPDAVGEYRLGGGFFISRRRL